MSLNFEAFRMEPGTHAFSGVFLTQSSYVALLKLADTYFPDLRMSSVDRQLPCLRNSYMLMTRSQRNMFRGINRKASLTIDRLIYNAHFGVLAAGVQMRNNVTDNDVPHVLLAKRDNNVNNATVGRVINGECCEEFPSIEEYLISPFKVHGKIGVMVGSDETPQAEIKYIGGVKMQQTHEYVDRPEVSITVEAPPPATIKRSPMMSFDQFKQHARDNPVPTSNDTMQITLEKSSGPSRKASQEPVHTGEYYKGEPVMKGPRGGKFIIKDEKKIYVKDKDIGSGSGSGEDDVVFKINMLKTGEEETN